MAKTCSRNGMYNRCIAVHFFYNIQPVFMMSGFCAFNLFRYHIGQGDNVIAYFQNLGYIDFFSLARATAIVLLKIDGYFPVGH